MEHRFRAQVRVLDDFSNSEDRTEEIENSYGVAINVHSSGQGSVTDYYMGPVEGWQLLEATLPTEASPGEFQFNLLFGGWGDAIDTVRLDNTELTCIGGSDNGLEFVYNRVIAHIEAMDGGGDDGGSDDDGSDVILSSSIIEPETESDEG